MRHEHADLMIAYANDTTLEFECRNKDGGGWEAMPRAIPTFMPNFEYRIKPTKARALNLAKEIKESFTNLCELGELDEYCLERLRALVQVIKQL